MNCRTEKAEENITNILEVIFFFRIAAAVWDLKFVTTQNIALCLVVPWLPCSDVQ